MVRSNMATRNPEGINDCIANTTTAATMANRTGNARRIMYWSQYEGTVHSVENTRRSRLDAENTANALCALSDQLSLEEPTIPTIWKNRMACDSVRGELCVRDLSGLSTPNLNDFFAVNRTYMAVIAARTRTRVTNVINRRYARDGHGWHVSSGPV